MTEEALPQTSRSRRWLRRGLVLGLAVVAGIVISDLALTLQGPRYAASLTVRPLIDNPDCLYLSCPNQSATAGGYQWIISQANLVQSQAVAKRVHDAIKGAPSVATLMSNVRVKENNNSDSIDITYTGKNPGQAQRLAVSFAKNYERQVPTAIIDRLKGPTHTTLTTWNELVTAGLTRTPRGIQVRNQLNTLQTANNLASNMGANNPFGAPGAPVIYAAYPSLVPVQKTTPSLFRATLLGAATGLVVGFALVLAMGSSGPRRPRRLQLRRRRPAVAGEA